MQQRLLDPLSMLLINCIRHDIDLASQVASPRGAVIVELILWELPSTQVTLHSCSPAKTDFSGKFV